MFKLREKLLWARARDYLKRYQPLVIAIAGSRGSYAAATAIAHVLAQHHRVRIASPARDTLENIALGILGSDEEAASKHVIAALAGTLTREISEQEPDVIIVALSPRRPGEVDRLSQLLQPRIRAVLNAHTTATSYFTEKKLVAHELESLVATAKEGDTLILGMDDQLVSEMQDRAPVATVGVGEVDGSHIQLLRTDRLPAWGFAGEVRIDDKSHEFSVPQIIAESQLSGVLAAIAVGHTLKLGEAFTLKRLQTVRAPAGHLRVLDGVSGSKIIDDSAHATAESIIAGLKLLKSVGNGPRDKGTGKRVAVLGDVLELGRQSEHSHRLIGKAAGEAAQLVVCVGEAMREAAEQAVLLGADVHRFDTATEAAGWLPEYLKENDLVYVTGHADMRMNEIIERLKRPSNS